MTMFDQNSTQAINDSKRSGVVVALRNTDGSEYRLEKSERRWVVGSGASCDIVLDDVFVSTIHCVLERRAGGGLVVRDRKSKNGTTIDSNPIESAELRVGSHLVIGRTTLVAVAAPGLEASTAREMIRGHDPALIATIDQAVRAAQTDCNVLIVGETGTGKDLLARVIHETSRRAGNRFVPVNCGAIPRELIGSELFGHEKGAFTGATSDRDGFFVEAHNGTLFLDEIGELPLEMQPHLLRALEARRVRPLGAAFERAVDVRIVAATNRIEKLGGEGSRLRLDVYHRLAHVVLSLPSLRERMGDLAELVVCMLAEHEPEHGPKKVSEAAWKVLSGYAWPGNVRELRGAVARAVALGGDTLGPADFFPEIRFGRSPHITALAEVETDKLVPYQAMLRGAMEQALSRFGTIRAAAHHMGMAKSTFADKARAWGLVPRPRARIGSAIPVHVAEPSENYIATEEVAKEELEELEDSKAG